MTLVVILFMAGVLLIAAGGFLPGGVLGVIGGAAMVGGVFASYSEFGSFGAVISSSIAFVLIIFALFFEFKILPKTSIGKRLFLNKTIKGVSNYSKASDEVVGQVGKTVTALGPTGFVLLDGVKLEAASKSGFIEKNEQVKVTGKDNFRIIVSKI